MLTLFAFQLLDGPTFVYYVPFKSSLFCIFLHHRRFGFSPFTLASRSMEHWNVPLHDMDSLGFPQFLHQLNHLER